MTTCADRQLKLVFPKGIVKILKQPVTAAQVMDRHPRHCVTRPDFFQFPWLVIRPESVLKLGRVFYVVPIYTIYRMLHPRNHNNNNNNNHDDDAREKLDYSVSCSSIEVVHFERLDEDRRLRGEQSSRELRSCLKKENSRVGKSAGLRVRFALDYDDVY